LELALSPPLSYSNIKNKNDYTSTHQVGEALYKHKTYTAPHLASKDRNGKKMKKKTKKKILFSAYTLVIYIYFAHITINIKIKLITTLRGR
jgi:hypothetical protein